MLGFQKLKPRGAFQNVISSLLCCLLAVQPALLAAQTHDGSGIIVNGPDDGVRPHVDTAANGTPVVNISTPDGDGVSHDVYDSFSVGDAILNNSATSVQSGLGGFIEGNANLTPGNEAELWIGEVIGGSESQLTGILEVAGEDMDVVLANEFGITCDGCGFVNTGRATLTTGAPVFGADGAFTGFDVTQGVVRVGPNGLNPADRVGLSDTGRVDVIARAAEIYGVMRADSLNIVAGANTVAYDWDYDPVTGTMTGITPQSGAGNAPLLAVDVSALGGMYANAMRMVATESGVGVHIDGTMASTGDIAISASGRLTLGQPSTTHTPQLRATRNVRVVSTGPIQLEGAIVSEDGALVQITSGETLSADGAFLGGAVVLESAGLTNISAAIAAQDALQITSTNDAVAVAAEAVMQTGALSVAAAQDVTFLGQAAVGQNTELVAGNDLSFGEGAILQVAGAAQLEAVGNIDLAGTLVAQQDVTVGAGQDIAVLATGVVGGAEINITGGDVSNAGTILSQTRTGIEATNGDILNTGTLGSQGELITQATGSFTNEGVIQADIFDVTSPEALVFADGSGLTARVVQFTAPALTNNGTLAAFETLSLTTTLGDMVNTGTLYAGDALALTSAGDLTNSGVIASGDALDINVEGQFTNTADGQLTGQATNIQTQSLLNDGVVQAAGLDVLSAATLTNTGTLYATQDASFFASQMSNTGLVAAQDGLEVTVTNGLNSSGDLISGADLSLAASQLAFNGSVSAVDTLAITGTSGITTGVDAELAAHSIEISGAFENAGAAKAVDSLALTGPTLTNSGDLVASNAMMVETTSGALNNTGTIYSDDQLVVTSATALTNSGTIAAGSLANLTAATGLSGAGDYVSGGDLFLTVESGDGSFGGTLSALSSYISIDGDLDLGSTGVLSGENLISVVADGYRGTFDGDAFGRIRSDGLAAVSLANERLVVGSAEQALFAGDVLLDLGGGVQNAGLIQTDGAFELLTNGAVDNLGGTLAVGSNLTVKTDGVVTNDAGTIAAAGNILVTGLTGAQAAGLNNYSGIIAATDGDMILQAAIIENSRPAPTVTTETTVVTTVNGNVTTRDETVVEVASFGAEPSQIWASGDLLIQGDTVTNAYSSIEAGGDLTVLAATLNNVGTDLVTVNTVYEDTRRSRRYCKLRILGKCIWRGTRYYTTTEITGIDTWVSDTAPANLSSGGDLVASVSVLNNASIMDAGVTGLAAPEMTLPGASVGTLVPSIDLTEVLSSVGLVGAPSFDSSSLDPNLSPDDVAPDTVTAPQGGDVSAPDLPAGTDVAGTVTEGESTFAETDPTFATYEGYLTSNYLMGVDRLEYRDELVNAVTSPTGPAGAVNLAPIDFSSALDAVVPPEGVFGAGSSFELTGDGQLAVLADTIFGSGGAFDASGDIVLASSGVIGLNGTQLSGQDITLSTASGEISIGGMESALGGSINDLFSNGMVPRGAGNQLSTIPTAIDAGGVLNIASATDLTLAGTQITSGGNTLLTSGGDLTFDALSQVITDDRTGGTFAYSEALVGSLTSGGDLVLGADAALTLIGTGLTADGAITATAGTDLTLAAATTQFHESFSTRSGGWFSSVSDSYSMDQLTHIGSQLTAGGDLTLASDAGDLTFAGADLVADGNALLSSMQGNILSGTYTDVNSQSYALSSSLLGGLLSSSIQTSSVDQLAFGSDTLAGADLALVSGTDTTLIGGGLSAGGALSIATGGHFSVEAAVSSTSFDSFTSDMGLVLATTETTSLFEETAEYAAISAGSYAFDIGGDATLALYQQAGVDAPNPNDLFPQELLALEGLELLNEDLAFEYFHEETQALSPAFKALVSIAVGNFVAPGLVSAVLPNASGWLAAGAEAFAGSFIVESLDGIVSGDFDLGDILEGAVFSGVSAGLTAGINLKTLGIELGNGASNPLLGFGQVDGNGLTLTNLLEGGLDGALSSGLSSAVYGTDFMEGFGASLASTVVNLTLADAQFEIGELGLEEGSFEHALLHGLAGCVAAEAQGADCATGAAAGAAQAIYAGWLDEQGLNAESLTQEQRDQYLASAERIGALVGFAFSGGDPENVTLASVISRSGLENNYLERHYEHGSYTDYVCEQRGMGLTGDACAGTLRAEYEEVSVLLGEDREAFVNWLLSDIDAQLASESSELDAPITTCSQRYGICTTTTRRTQLQEIANAVRGLNGLAPSNAAELQDEAIAGILTLGLAHGAGGIINRFRTVRAADATNRAGTGADNVGTYNPLKAELAAEEIAQGHGFQKHVVNGREFEDLGITERYQYQAHVESVINNPSDIRYYVDGRTVYLDAETRTVVVRNPNAGESTAFRPAEIDYDDYISTLPIRNEPYIDD